MAKSKVGGSRAYIKGRIGSDVYSIGKDGKGQRQQVVRSLAEQVANPRSQAQMFNRMIMSTVMQAVSAMSPIIDHSFDGLTKGQPNISEFIRRNYALVKADAVSHPASGNSFGLNKYQEKGIKAGAYVVSAGKVEKPALLYASGGMVMITLSSQTLTVGGLKAALGLSADGYITAVGIVEGYGFSYTRYKLTTTLSDDTAITAGNVGSLFTMEGSETPAVTLDDTYIVLRSWAESEVPVAYGVIVSEKVDGAWQHSDATLKTTSTPAENADTALPTYPVGNEQFLNGGDI